MDREKKAEFPRLTKVDGSAPPPDLFAALRRVLRKSDWDGEVSEGSLAKALHNVAQKIEDAPDTIGDNEADLLYSLAGSLREPFSQSQWRLHLTRKGGRGRKPLSRRQLAEIADFFEDQLEEAGPGGFDSARTKTREEFNVSNSTITKARAELQKDMEAMAQHAKDLADLLQSDPQGAARKLLKQLSR